MSRQKAGVSIMKTVSEIASGQAVVRTVPLAELKGAPYNPRAISPQALAGLKASIKRFGLVQPIVRNRRTGFIVGAIEAARFEIRCQIIWAKPFAPISRGAYRWQHEPCWYAVRKGASAAWLGDHNEATIWAIANRTFQGGRGEAHDAITGHGTQKPVECMAHPIRNHDAPEVYDPFLGSGTTLIAAEQLGRTCYGLEIEPAYCDVIVERWQNLTGGKATRETVAA
jgi:DNA modification methylase